MASYRSLVSHDYQPSPVCTALLRKFVERLVLNFLSIIHYQIVHQRFVTCHLSHEPPRFTQAL